MPTGDEDTHKKEILIQWVVVEGGTTSG